MKVPLGVFTCLTGVSGSGKSTLAHDVLYLNALVEKGAVCEEEPARVKSIKGWEHLDEVVMVDQSPIVRAPLLPFMPEFLKKYAPSSQKRRRPARAA